MTSKHFQLGVQDVHDNVPDLGSSRL